MFALSTHSRPFTVRSCGTLGLNERKTCVPKEAHFWERAAPFWRLTAMQQPFSNKHTSPHGFLPWPEALGSNNSCVSAASLGWVLTYLTHLSGGWRFEEKSWHLACQFTAILHGKAENYNGTNPWRLFVCEGRVLYTKKKWRRKTHIFPHCSSIIGRDANFASKEIRTSRENIFWIFGCGPSNNNKMSKQTTVDCCCMTQDHFTDVQYNWHIVV